MYLQNPSEYNIQCKHTDMLYTRAAFQKIPNNMQLMVGYTRQRPASVQMHKNPVLSAYFRSAHIEELPDYA